MTSPVTGEPTHAIFAFTGMLIKLFDEHRPDFGVLTIDETQVGFRRDIFPDYKANRDETPEELKQQIPRMLEVARLLGLPVLGSPDAEADDIMATLAKRHASHDLKVRLVSKDKDLEQLLTDQVTLFDIHTDTELDVAGLAEKKGIRPDQAIEHQVLTGDTADNIPGVPGIGSKTATKLLTQFGSLENLTSRIDELKGKQKENLQAAISEGQFDLVRRLVTLDQDLDIELDLDAAKLSVDAIDVDALLDLFDQLGFHRHKTDLQRLVKRDTLAANQAIQSSQVAAAEHHAMPGGLFSGLVHSTDSGSEPGHPPAPMDALAESYQAITTRDALDTLVKELADKPLVAVDTETFPDGKRTLLCGISLSWAAEQGVYIPLRCPPEDEHLDEATVLDALRAWFADASRAKCGHNMKYDLRVLHAAGVVVRGVAFDSMVAAFLAGANGIGMDALALAEFGRHNIPISALMGPKPTRKNDPPQRTMDQVPLSEITPYAAEDADITLRLCELFRARLQAMDMTTLMDTVEVPLVSVLAGMEDAGIRVDPCVLEAQREQLQARADAVRSEILDAVGFDFNPDSPKQLSNALFHELGFPKQRKTKTGYSTDSEVLEKLASLSPAELKDVPEAAHAVPRLLVEYRMLTKLVGTYLVNLVEAIWTREQGGDERVHARFHQTGAATGRLSSSDPNLQNIPIRTEVGRQIRRAFIAEPGQQLVSADYSQVELRMLAHLAEDVALIEAFNSGQDIHRAVAAEVFKVEPEAVTSEQRGHAKTINFGIIYGVTPFGLARRIEGLNLDAATTLIADYKARFTGIDRFLQECVEQASEHGYVTTLLGRRRRIDDIHARNPQKRALAERLAINSVVQGSAADLIKKAMVDLDVRLRAEYPEARLLLQIHDELVVEAPAAIAQQVSNVVVETMQQAMTLKVPLGVDAGIGADWYSAK